MFSLKEMHSKYETEGQLLKWIAENNSEKVTKFFGVDLLPAGANYSQMDWKLEHEISEHAVTVMYMF